MGPLSRCLAIVLIAGQPVAALADRWEPGTTHAGVQYSHLDMDAGGGIDSANPGAIMVRAGHQASDIFGVEGRLGIRTRGDELNDVTVRLDRLFGLYVTAHAPLGNRFSAYAIGGWSDARVSARNGDDRHSGTEAGVSAGIGLDYAVDPDFRLNLEYMRYLHTGDIDLSAVGIGLSIRL